jgi:hypothetical protein
MLLKIGIGFVALVALLLIVAALKPSTFHVARETTIGASADKIFPHINNLKTFNEWNPWVDPKGKAFYEGPEAGVGAVHKWEGPGQGGAGTMTITDVTESSQVKMRLDFEKPLKGTSYVEFNLSGAGNGTKVVWSMSGESSFVARIFCTLLFMNPTHMISQNFDKGLATLKAKMESQN